MADQSSNATRNITITYSISIPSESATSIKDTTLDPKRSISIPLAAGGDLSSLSVALDKARAETNDTLTRWKDEIGEAEKVKEVRVAKEAEERKRNAKKAKLVQGDEEDAGESDEDEEEME